MDFVVASKEFSGKYVNISYFLLGFNQYLIYFERVVAYEQYCNRSSWPFLSQKRRTPLPEVDVKESQNHLRKWNILVRILTLSSFSYCLLMNGMKMVKEISLFSTHSTFSSLYFFSCSPFLYYILCGNPYGRLLIAAAFLFIHSSPLRFARLNRVVYVVAQEDNKPPYKHIFCDNIMALALVW